jgi:hypothetical protein
LRLVGELTVPEQVNRFFKGGMLGERVDVVAEVAQNALSAVM